MRGGGGGGKAPNGLAISGGTFIFFCGFPKLTCNRVIWFHVTEQETQLFLSVLAERDGTSKPQSQKKYVKHVFFPSNWDTFFL